MKKWLKARFMTNYKIRFYKYFYFDLKVEMRTRYILFSKCGTENGILVIK